MEGRVAGEPARPWAAGRAIGGRTVWGSACTGSVLNIILYQDESTKIQILSFLWPQKPGCPNQNTLAASGLAVIAWVYLHSP